MGETKAKMWRVRNGWTDDFDFARLWIVEYLTGWWIFKYWKTWRTFHSYEDARHEYLRMIS